MSFLAVFLVNNSLSGHWLFLASRLTIVNLESPAVATARAAIGYINEY